MNPTHVKVTNGISRGVFGYYAPVNTNTADVDIPMEEEGDQGGEGSVVLDVESGAGAGVGQAEGEIAPQQSVAAVCTNVFFFSKCY